MTYLFIALSLFVVGMIVAFGLALLGVTKNNISVMCVGWGLGVISLSLALVYAIIWIMWIISLFN